MSHSSHSSKSYNKSYDAILARRAYTLRKLKEQLREFDDMIKETRLSSSQRSEEPSNSSPNTESNLK